MFLRSSAFCKLLLTLTLTSMASGSSHQDQPPSPPASNPSQRLDIHAYLLLPPTFCKSKTGRINTGEKACEILGRELKPKFSSLTEVDAEPQLGRTDLVFIPRIVGVEATPTGFNSQVITIQFEWTVRDDTSAPVWIEEVEGSGSGHIGNTFTAKKDADAELSDAIKDAAARSAVAMSSSPELQSVIATLKNPAANNPQRRTGKYFIKYVNSQQTWKHGVTSTSYDDIASQLQDRLNIEIHRKGFTPGSSAESSTCLISVEVLSVRGTGRSIKDELNPLSTATPSVSVNALISIVEKSTGKTVYSVETEGSYRDLFPAAQTGPTITYHGVMVRAAVANLVHKISSSDSFNKAMIGLF